MWGKLFLAIVAALLVMSAPAAMAQVPDYIPSNLQTGLVSYWAMEDDVQGAGQTIQDAMPADNDGTTLGNAQSPDCKADGYIGRGCSIRSVCGGNLEGNCGDIPDSYYCDDDTSGECTWNYNTEHCDEVGGGLTSCGDLGSNACFFVSACSWSAGGYVDIAGSSSLDIISGLTLSALINITSNDGHNAIIERTDHSGNGYNGFKFLVRSSNEVGDLITEVANAGSTQRFTSNVPLGLNQYYHVVFSAVNGGAWALYVDGEMKNSGTMSSSWTVTPNNNMLIGRINSLRYRSSFSGTMDEVAIWNRALTEPDVQNLYSSYLCNNGVKDSSETDIDCNGDTCAPCANGQTCFVGYNCQSGNCVDGICTSICAPDGCNGNCPSGCAHAQDPDCGTATCSDNCQNGGETGVDCGGSCSACSPTPPSAGGAAPGFEPGLVAIALASFFAAVLASRRF